MKLLISIFLFLFSISLFSQTKLISPLKAKHTLSYTDLIGGIIVLEVFIDNQKDTLHFIFDTGSNSNSLDSSTAKILNIQMDSTPYLVKGIAGKKIVFFSNNHSIKIGTFQLLNQRFSVIDYSLLSYYYGVKIDGILGTSILKNHIWQINRDSSKMYIYDTNYTFKFPKNSYSFSIYNNKLPAMPIQIKEQINTLQNTLFDMGAGLHLLFSNDFVKEYTFFNPNKKMLQTQVEGLGGKILLTLTTTKKIKLGNFVFRNVPTNILIDDNNVLNYPQKVGLIGGDLLRRFNIILNYAKNTINISPNMHYFEDFDYSYTGLTLYQINNRIVVSDIIENSPAHQSGIMLDDIIIAINNKAIANVNDAKIALQNSKNIAHLIILRQFKPHEINMKIEYIK